MKSTFFLLFFTLFTSQLTAQNRLTPEILWSLGQVSLQDVSPDGNTVIYGVKYYNIEKNKGATDLYSVSIKDGVTAAKQLTATAGNEYSARFRPDGKKIGYLKNSVIWEMNPDGSGQKAVSDFKVTDFKYAPDITHILYVKEVKQKKTTADLYPDLPKANALVIDDLMYRHWDDYEDENYSNIFVAKYTDGSIAGEGPNIMNEPFDSPLRPFGGMEQINWSHDSQSIVYVSKKLSGRDYAVSTNSDIYQYSLRTGKTKNLTAGNKGYDLDPVISPDGKYIAYNSMAKDGYEADRYRLMILEVTSGNITELTKGFDHNAHSPQWAADGQSLFFTSERDGMQHLYQIQMQDGRISQLTKGTYNYYDFSVTKEGLVARRCSMSEPHEIYFVPFGKAKPYPLTAINTERMASLATGKVESRTVKTTDGKDMQVWMIFPPNFDKSKKYPTLLYCQGGPQSQVSQFWSTRWNFQMMAANDYIIVAPNRRGLPGFGTEWNEAISGDWGGQAMRDYLSAIDEAAKEPYVDADRLGAVGASFGGYSVYWLAGNHDKRFKTFIAHCGLFNLESWYGTTEELFFANQDIGGPYWDKKLAPSYMKNSPHKFVQNWDTPILVIHNEKDFRVPISEGMQAFNAAQMRGIPSRFLMFPEENHWVLTPQNGILWQRVFFDWLDRSLKK